MLLPQSRNGRGVLNEGLVCLIPMHPGEVAVLGVGVVVALLGATEFVTVQHHRHPLREQKSREEIALLTTAQREHGGVVCRALDAAVV